MATIEDIFCHDSSSTFSLDQCPRKLKFYTREEVAVHSKLCDCWVIIHKRIFNVSCILKAQTKPTPLIDQLVAYGGRDLSDFFLPDGSPKTRISLRCNEVPVFEAAALTYPNYPHSFWWNDINSIIGLVTKATIKIRIINCLTAHSYEMFVCDEDTLEDIQVKYAKKVNFHMGSYTWRKTTPFSTKPGRLLLNLTLRENGYTNTKVPVLYIYYNDDFTVA